jgi:Gas vesicle synthesis protein GvpL/GvpF
VTGDAAYVYAVARAGPSRELAGIGGATVRAVEAAGLRALVSDVPAGWRTAGRADLAAHDRVLAALIESETVVPLRFGVVMASDEEVRERLLEHHAGELAALLDKLDGHVQMSVRAYYLEDALLRAVLAQHPGLKRRADALGDQPVARTQQERIGLGREVAAAVEEQRARDEEMLVAPLAAVAADVRVDPLPSERQAASIQLLVRADRRPALDEAVRRLAREHGDRFAIRYVGPLAPYSFSDLVLDTEPRAWA